jgi:FAD/FMN-containing dehydrogenase
MSQSALYFDLILFFSHGYGPQVIEHGYENDLKYAMRASGGSFGIVTEFVYKMYPKPETLSLLLLIFVENEYDFMKLNKAAQDGRYAVTVFEPVFLRRPETSHVVSSITDHNKTNRETE